MFNYCIFVENDKYKGTEEKLPLEPNATGIYIYIYTISCGFINEIWRVLQSKM